tara:strand:+ start:138 stop:1175 length:1038 start_codon:yes stop_codon:yes gene_type:complete
MTFEIAKRQATPLLISYVGTSGSGKTLSALLTAGGLVSEGGKVGFIDTELGRGRVYADDQEVIKAIPGGKYFVKDITAPFSPSKYAAAVKEAIEASVDVLIIDSATHWWEGSGGCQDIAENNKTNGGMPNWAKAKMENKKLMNMLTQCPMHIIFCVRAREKSKPVKVVDKNGKEKIEIVNEGLQAIQEKNFMYDMTVSLIFDEENPGKPKMLKCPKPLRGLFDDKSFVTKLTGIKLKSWSDGGASVNKQLRNLKREITDAAGCGSGELKLIYDEMKENDNALLKLLWTVEFSEQMKTLAKESDEIEAVKSDQEISDEINENQNQLLTGLADDINNAQQKLLNKSK